MATVDAICELIGDPEKVDEELQAFDRTAKCLSEPSHHRVIERYPGQWIAVHTGRVRAHGESLDSVLAQLDSEGLSREQAIVRFIHDKPRTVIL